LSDATSPELAPALRAREARLLQVALAFLGLSAAALWLAPAARPPGAFRPAQALGPLLLLLLWAGTAWLVHRMAAQRHPLHDPLLLPVGMLLLGWGGLIIWRLSPGLGLRQTVWIGLGMVILLAVLRGPADLRWLRRYRYVWLSAGLSLTALTLIFGTHPGGGEPHLWLGCCGFYLQPSEPLRLLLIAFLASYLADRILAGWTGEGQPQRTKWLPLLLAWGTSVLLLVAQRDLGMGTLLLLVLAILLYVATGSARLLLLAAVLGLAGGALGYWAFDVVQARVSAWLYPWLDPTGGGYQSVQAAIAMASGGLIGSGPGLGSPGFVPVVQSDFVYAAVVEEWGLLGGLAMLACYMVLISRGLRTAARARDPFFMLLAAGICAALGAQTLLILAGTLRLLPITGVTLPFISYGGSSLVTNMIGLALLLVLSGDRAGGSGEFARPLVALQRLFTLGWVVLALALGWWVVYRGPALQQRSDNQRRALASRLSPRGEILDSRERVLAETVGEAGSYSRRYPVPEVAPAVGYDTPGFGQSGVERSLDGYLRGEIGPDPFAVAWRRLLTGVPPPGWSVRLSLDLELQVRLAGALQGARGAAVLLEANTGRILALASSPSFDPNRLAEDWETLLASQEAPLLNRATQGRYQPGLALAPLLYAWGLEQGAFAEDQGVADLTRPLTVGDLELGCRVEPPSGVPPTLETALRMGCPSPLADLAGRLGEQSLQDMLQAFGLTEAPAIRLEVGEVSIVDLSGDPLALREAAVGQGDLLVSPLQLARAFAALPGAGIRPALTLAEAVGVEGQPWQRLPALQEDSQAVTPTVAQRSLETLGTSSAGLASYRALGYRGAAGETIAWYLGARVGEGPRRVVVVVLEDGDLERAEQIGQAGLLAP
jgi:cell division protein FtsW (lipid II flippase)